METKLKRKVLKALRSLKENEIVHEAIYKCANDGLVCFNGMVAELVNGFEYDVDSVQQDVDDEEWDYQFREYMRDVENSLLDRGIKVGSEEWEEEISNAEGDFEYNYDGIDSSIVEERLSNEILEDLARIYEDDTTRSIIDDVHVAMCHDEITFDDAKKKVIEIIKTQE